MTKQLSFTPETIERLPISTLKPYPRNPRMHSPAQVEKIARSISTFGWTLPILIDDTNEIIAGHGRLMAAEKLGVTSIPAIRIKHLTQDQVRALRISDNQTVIAGEWDDDILGQELHDLGLADFDLSLTGFDSSELDILLSPLNADEGLTDPDDIPEEQAEIVSKLVDLWILGQHRLLCGDSTNEKHLSLLMNSHKAKMVFTDPPYGVDYTGGMKRRERLSGDNIGTDIYKESLIHLANFADDKAPLYLWYADGHAAAAAAAAAGYQVVAQIIWAKNHAQFVTSAHYKGKHEPCFYAHRRGKSARWHGPNNEVTLWECDRSPRNDFHPTQKPVELAERAIRNSTEHLDEVLDMFLGGGTTLIASEATGRTCYALEIAPQYVDVAVRRWQNYTGKQAVLEETGKTFAETADERLS